MGECEIEPPLNPTGYEEEFKMIIIKLNYRRTNFKSFLALLPLFLTISPKSFYHLTQGDI